MKKIIPFLVLGFCLSVPAGARIKKSKKQKMMHNATTQNRLAGTWVLTYMEGGDVASLFKDKKPTFVVDEQQEQVSGFAGCNQYFGAIRIENFHISFPNPLARTLMACLEPNGEEVFMEALGRVNSYALTGKNQLHLLAGDIGIMTLERVQNP